MTPQHHTAYVVIVATRSGDRYFKYVKRGRVTTAWCIAGATLFMTEQCAAIWMHSLSDTKRLSATVHKVAVSTLA